MTLVFRKSFRQIGEFCSDAASCQSGRGVASEIAQAYDLARERGEAFDAGRFSAGLMPEAELVEVVEGLGRASPPEFPVFAANKYPLDVYTTGYSGVALQYFPLQLEGVWFVGLVGHAGVGWRESRVTLVSLFKVIGGSLKPVAGFQIEAEREALIQTSVDE